MVKSAVKYSLGMSTCSLLALALSIAAPRDASAQANERSSRVQDKALAEADIEMNSGNCGYTFFTGGNDNIDFTGSATGDCFDMLAGDDTLVVDRNTYPKGVKIFTGRGHDTVSATDGPDIIIDAGGEDSDIRAFGGDDKIEINLAVDKDPLRGGVETTERTEIRPGSGHNTINIGTNIYSDAFVRVSPDVWLWAEPEAVDKINVSCGRPQDAETFDLRVMELPENAAMSIKAMGCGIGAFGAFGTLDIDQVGGRFALRTQGEKFRTKAGTTLPVLRGKVIAGRGVFMDVTASDPSSEFLWQGSGEAVIRADMEDASSGGAFTVSGMDDVIFDANLGPAQAAWTLTSFSRVQVDLHAATDRTHERLTLAAPIVDVSWSFEGGVAFPSIKTKSDVEARVGKIDPVHIEFFAGTLAEKAKLMANTSMGLAPANAQDTGVLNTDLPEGIADLVVSQSQTQVAPGRVDLSMDLRKSGGSSDACFSVSVVDDEGLHQSVEAKCESAASALKTMTLGDASDYERIIVTGPKSFEVEINGKTDFSVSSLKIRL